MLRLARQFQNRVRDYQEYSRLIEREKLILAGNANNVVLPDEFFFNAVRPLYAHQAHLSGMFNKMGVVFYNIALKGPSAEDAPDYLMTFGQLSHDMQLFYLARRFEQEKWGGNEPINTDKVFPFGDSMVVPSGSRSIIETLYLDFSEEAAPDKRYYRGVPLGFLVAYMNVRRSLLTSELSSYETVSLMKGQGNDVLEFWRSVNDLTDYSHLFSNKPKPPRKDPPQKPEWVKEAGWKPAFGNGF